METIRMCRGRGLLLPGLLLVCFCATADSIQPRLPAEVNINQEAGCGGHLSVMVRLEDGEELPFDVDTGSPITLFDKSLKPKLGKTLDSGTIWMWGTKQKSTFHAAPKIYLGNIPLMTGTNVATYDFKKMKSRAGHRLMGILGMDCLAHYCIQMDFEAGKMRFLNPDRLNEESLGKSFPLSFSNTGQSANWLFRTFIHHGNLVGGQGTNLLIDTGLDIDGALEPGLLREQKLRAEGGVKKLDETRWYFRKCVWEGETYTNILVREVASGVAGEGANVVGLRFLARHLVTFDFPHRTMYLRRRSSGPLPNDSLVLMDTLINSLMVSDGKLPGDIDVRLNAVLKDQSQTFWFPWHGETLALKKDDDPATYHYAVVRESRHAPWKLRKAWRTDQKGRTVEKYSVP